MRLERTVALRIARKREPRNQRVFLGFHTSNGSHSRYRGLAYRRNMEIRTERLEHRDTAVDVIVEVEAPCCEGHHLVVGPVSDEHLMCVEEGHRRAAQ